MRERVSFPEIFQILILGGEEGKCGNTREISVYRFEQVYFENIILKDYVKLGRFNILRIVVENWWWWFRNRCKCLTNKDTRIFIVRIKRMLRRKGRKKNRSSSRKQRLQHPSIVCLGLYRGSDVFVPRQGMQIITTRTFVMAAINLTAESLSSKYDKGFAIRKSQRGLDCNVAYSIVYVDETTPFLSRSKYNR